MGYFKAGKGKELTAEHNKETVQDVLKYPFVHAKDRNISKETCERFGVRAGLSEKDGKTVEAYYFPSYNQKGKIVGFMKQDITKSKEEKYHWTTVGSVTISNKLFGQDVVETTNRKRSNLVITEGQWDCLSTFEALVDGVKGTKYEGLEPLVCSIPLGTSNAVEAILHNKEFVESFDGATIFFDDDCCTPLEKQKGIVKGHEAREAVAGALVGSKLAITTLQTQDGYKDASDYMQAGRSKELAKLVQFEKKVYVPEKIISVNDVSLDEICEDAPVGVTVKEFPKLMEKTWGIHRRVVTLVAAPSGVGKCLAKGTKVMMHDFSLKNVEDIVAGDKLIGPDGTHRNVLSTTTGVDEMYRIDQVNGISYTVNSAHILSFKYSNSRGENTRQLGIRKYGEVINMNVVDYTNLSSYNKSQLKGWKASFDNQEGVAFDKDETYLLGLWLADGTSAKSQITINKKDTELFNEIDSICKAKGYSQNISPSNDRSGCTAIDISGGMFKFLKDNCLLNNKHIPEKYFTASKETKLELVAGFIDGDGYYTNNCITFTQKKCQLTYDMIRMMRSLGFVVKHRESFQKCQNFAGDYYIKISVSGNLDAVPNRLQRKSCHKRLQVKNASVTGVSVTHVGVGDYYGFTLDGDHLFCLEDGTVTHNTTAVSIIENSIGNAGFKTGLIFLEETTKETIQRKIAFDLKINFLKFKRSPLSCAPREQIAEARARIISNNNNPSLLDHFGSISLDKLMSKIKYMHEIEKCDYIILDHISMTISGLDVQDERKELDMVSTELAAYASSHDVGIIVVCHLNRQGTADQFKVKKGDEDKPYWVRVTKESLRGSAGLEQLSMVILGLEPEILPSRERGRVRWVVLKNRPAGELGQADVFKLDAITWEVILCGDEQEEF